MKRFITILALALVCILAMPCLAQASISFDGKVVAGETVAVAAPFGGPTRDIALRKGDLVRVGDAIATIETTLVYAPEAGTVSGVFGQEGDGAESIGTRYGAVVYINPVNRYKISASTEKAHNSSQTKFISVGESVYLSCTQDGTHTGTAVVTKVEPDAESGNSKYELEVTGGEFYMGETVGIYRRSDYVAESRIGRGVVAQNTAIAVSATGSILKMHVHPGDEVERGELLFETVEGVLDGLFAMDNHIVSNVAGVVASVEVTTGGSVAKGGSMITVYPLDSFQLEVNVSERDLNDIHEGDAVYIEFDWDVDGSSRCQGKVESISHVSNSETGAAQYSAYISFEADENVRLGMSAMAYLIDEEDLPAENPVETPAEQDAEAEG